MVDSPPDVDIDAMDWGPGGIEIGTQEAEEAATALVSAAMELNGASAGPSTETRCAASPYEPLWGPTEGLGVPHCSPLMRARAAPILQLSRLNLSVERPR